MIAEVEAPATSSASDFRRRKLVLALSIMAVGMFAALACNSYQGWVLGKGYPSNTFLFRPEVRFNDFTDMTQAAGRANPYEDPYTPYLPLAWVVFRCFGQMPASIGLTLFLFIGVGGLFVLAVAVLADVIASPWKRSLAALLFLLLSYPVLIAVDRANIELLVVLLMACSLLLLARGRMLAAIGCLIAGASCKFYPFLLLLLFLRQRKLGMVAGAVLALLIVLFLSLGALSLPLQAGLELYGRNLLFLDRTYVYENYALEGSASLWNVYKVALISAAHLGFISAVDFSFDNRFLIHSYTVYTWSMAGLAVLLGLYVCLAEKEWLRCAWVLLLFLSIATPFGADYRLLYANIALVAVIACRTHRASDGAVLILLALAVIPKKEIYLTYAGLTETGRADVSMQVILNPLLIGTALFLTLYDARTYFDFAWSRQRWHRLGRTWLRPGRKGSP